MLSPRWQSGGLLLALIGGLVYLSTPAAAQFGLSKDARIDVKEPNSQVKIKLGEMQRGTIRVKGSEYKANLEVLKQSAQYFIFRVTHEDLYEPLSKGDLRARPESKSVDGLVLELSRTLLVASPDSIQKYTLDQYDYVEEYGAALDEAVRTVLSKNPPILIRVNAARMLSVAAKSGASAHAKTIGELLTHKFFKVGDKPLQTPPEVYYYALKAAENLLAAYHPVWHLDSARLTRHTLKDDQLIPLVKTLETIVLEGPTIMASAYAGEPKLPPTLPQDGTSPGSGPPATTPKDEPKTVMGKLDPTTLTPEQLQVHEFYRRQAVRALAKVRFDILGGSTPNEIRPGFTLAKVAVSDFSIVPAPSTAEIAEAVLGLINITPSSNLVIDEWAYIIARGTELMIAPKLESEENQTLPWRVTAARFNAALANLRKATTANPRLLRNQQSISKLCTVISSSIMDPIEKEDPTGAVKPSRDQLSGWMAQNPPKSEDRSLFDDVKTYRLTSRQGN